MFKQYKKWIIKNILQQLRNVSMIYNCCEHCRMLSRLSKIIPNIVYNIYMYICKYIRNDKQHCAIRNM